MWSRPCWGLSSPRAPTIGRTIAGALSYHRVTRRRLLGGSMRNVRTTLLLFVLARPSTTSSSWADLDAEPVASRLAWCRQERPMILGVGLDVVETERIAQALARHGRRFETRVYTAAELAESAARVERAQALAGRFDAKEALLKGLGTGLGVGIA